MAKTNALRTIVFLSMLLLGSDIALAGEKQDNAVVTYTYREHGYNGASGQMLSTRHGKPWQYIGCGTSVIGITCEASGLNGWVACDINNPSKGQLAAVSSINASSRISFYYGSGTQYSKCSRIVVSNDSSYL